MYYEKLTRDEVLAFQYLVLFLKRLRVVGTLDVRVTGHTFFGPQHVLGDLEAFEIHSGPTTYSIIKEGYSDEHTIDERELLESIFGRLSKNSIGKPI
jgi:hypothetical protein